MWVFFFFPSAFIGKSKLGFKNKTKQKKRAFWCYLERQPSKLLLWNWNLRFLGGFFQVKLIKPMTKVASRQPVAVAPPGSPELALGTPGIGRATALRSGEEKLWASAALLMSWVLRQSGALLNVRSGKSEQRGDNLSQFFKSVISWFLGVLGIVWKWNSGIA